MISFSSTLTALKISKQISPFLSLSTSKLLDHSLLFLLTTIIIIQLLPQKRKKKKEISKKYV